MALAEISCLILILCSLIALAKVFNDCTLLFNIEDFVDLVQR